MLHKKKTENRYFITNVFYALLHAGNRYRLFLALILLQIIGNEART